MENNENFEKLISKLAEIDNSILDRTPPDYKINEHVIEAKFKKQKQFYTELGLFIFIAIAVLAFLLSASFVMPIIIILSQILALAAIPTAFIIYRRTNKTGERLIK